MRTYCLAMSALLATCVMSWAQTFQAVPINDLGAASYRGYQGGLYENGTNVVPADHLADGQSLNSQIANGTRFVFLGIGMSDAENAFTSFQSLVNTTLGLDPNMTLIVGGQGSQNACEWAYATGTPAQNGCPLGTGSNLTNPYDVVITRLAPSNCGLKGHQACFSEADVRVVLYYDADSCRLVPHCYTLPDSRADAFTQEKYDGMMARAVKARYPNCQKLFIVSRQYGGYSTVNINPEPEAYENGFSAKWAIQAQIHQVRTGVIDSIAGDLSYASAPWIAWGPYTWASGETPRSDGQIWCQGQQDTVCNGELDFQPDGTHLSRGVGQGKWSAMALGFFETEPWFLAAPGEIRP